MERSYTVQKSRLEGITFVPSSKSQTMRAILFASLAKGISTITCPLDSPDTDAMILACESFGAKIERKKHTLTITGVNANPHFSKTHIDAKNSGQVLRFIGAIAALDSQAITITGDASIQKNRPILPLIAGLRGLGVDAEAKTGFAPIEIKGPVISNVTYLEGQDSQPVSGLIILAMFLDQTTTIIVNSSGETPWIDLTLSWLDRFGIVYQNDQYQTYTITGKKDVPGFKYSVPGDFSSCAFPIVAALVTGSEITIENIDMDDSQGDKELLFLLQDLGANLEIEGKKVHVKKSSKLSGGVVHVNKIIDALPILAVLGCFGKEPLHLCGAKTARGKESDRLDCITTELGKMGAEIQEYSDGLIIHPSALRAAELKSYNDHRIAMALSVAAMTVDDPSVIEDIGCIDKSYPKFLMHMQRLGAKIHEVSSDRV